MEGSCPGVQECSGPVRVALMGLLVFKEDEMLSHLYKSIFKQELNALAWLVQNLARMI